MFLPAEYTWFEPVLIAAIIVFIIDLIGSMLVFSRRPVLRSRSLMPAFVVAFLMERDAAVALGRAAKRIMPTVPGGEP